MLAVPGEEVDGVPCYRSLIRERAVPRQIMVNAAGRRFTDEASPYNDVGKAMHRARRLRLPERPRLHDHRLGVPPPVPVARRHAGRGSRLGRRAPASPRVLADTIGVDPDGLEQTVTRWNEACEQGVDPDFGRGGNPLRPLRRRPRGRPRRRTSARSPTLPSTPSGCWPAPSAPRAARSPTSTRTVLTTAGAPVPGLYAVGNAAAFWTGDAYPAPGATLAVGMTMGYLAGGSAAAGQSEVG